MKKSLLFRCLILTCALSVLAAAGCKRRTDAGGDAGPVAAVQYAVAPFTNPDADYKLLAGYLPEDAQAVSEGELARLDALLSDALSGKGKVRPLSVVAKCLVGKKGPEEMSRLGTLKYWQEAGQCAKADYLVIPQILTLRERVGSAMGVETSAKVVMNLFLMDVKTGGVVKYAHFDEEQRTLMDNILETGKFLERQGRWLTAMELAREGIAKGVTELGL